MFRDLSIVDMRDLYRISEQRLFSPGDAFITAGEPAGGLFVVVTSWRYERGDFGSRSS